MAGPACHFQVGAVELKFRITVMVKFLSFPAVGRMAASAIGVRWSPGRRLARLRELASVNIIVTSLASKRKIHKLQGGFAVEFSLVALSARDFSVPPLQRQFRLGVVKRRLPPALDQMAILASALGHILVDLPSVRILMACQAAGIIKCETYELGPAFQESFLMAGDTGNRQVASRERVIGFLVLLNCKFGRCKPIDYVAFFAGPLARARGELGVVIIAVAVLTKIEFHLLERSARKVALVACYCRVLAEERKTRLAMVKIGAVDTLPARGAMTPLAVLAEFVVMGVLVTIQASLVGQPLEFYILLIGLEFIVDHGQVTLIAFYAEVPAGQGEIGLVMIEFANRLPGGESVAISAFGQLTSMLIDVT